MTLRYMTVPMLAAAGLLIAGCSGDAELAVGDCTDQPPRPGDDVTTVDCDEGSHEVVAIDEVPPLEVSSWPGLAEMSSLVFDLCVDELEEYLGGPLTSVSVDVWYDHPDEDAFTDGDRRYLCAATTFGGEALDDSVRGAAE